MRGKQGFVTMGLVCDRNSSLPGKRISYCEELFVLFKLK